MIINFIYIEPFTVEIPSHQEHKNINQGGKINEVNTECCKLWGEM